MQIVADYFPLILFFVAYKVQGIYVATAVAIAASVLQIAYFLWRRGKVAGVHWMSLVIISVFGGATLIFHNDTFIKWKPTVLYWLFALVLAVGRLVFKRTLLASLLKELTLPDEIWARLTWAWVVFLIAMGVTNLYVAANFSTDGWVNFKVWWGIGLFMLAGVATVASVARYLPKESES